LRPLEEDGCENEILTSPGDGDVAVRSSSRRVCVACWIVFFYFCLCLLHGERLALGPEALYVGAGTVRADWASSVSRFA
jgi:hypothetical protein